MIVRICKKHAQFTCKTDRLPGYSDRAAFDNPHRRRPPFASFVCCFLYFSVPSKLAYKNESLINFRMVREQNLKLKSKGYPR